MPTTVYRTRDGSRVPSVTTILSTVINKPALIHWANRLGREGIKVSDYMDPLAEVGTAVHELCRSYLADMTGRALKWPDGMTVAQEVAVTSGYGKFLDWTFQHVVTPVQSDGALWVERSLVSEEYRFGGTLDCAALVDGRRAIVDFKTGKAIYDDHLFQVAGYCHLAREHGFEPEVGVLVRLGRDEDEGFEVVTWGGDHLRLGWTVFLHALRIYQAQKQLEVMKSA